MSGLEGGWLRSGGVGGCYQPGVYVPLKALFLVEIATQSKSVEYELFDLRIIA